MFVGAFANFQFELNSNLAPATAQAEGNKLYDSFYFSFFLFLFFVCAAELWLNSRTNLETAECRPRLAIVSYANLRKLNKIF